MQYYIRLIFTEANIRHIIVAICFQTQNTVTVSSDSDSDDSDIIKTTFDTSAPSSTRESVSNILAESDRLLKELKACIQVNVEGCKDKSVETRKCKLGDDSIHNM